MRGKSAASSQGLKVGKSLCVHGWGGGWGGRRAGGGRQSYNHCTSQCSHGKSLQGMVFKAYLYSFVPILIF